MPGFTTATKKLCISMLILMIPVQPLSPLLSNLYAADNRQIEFAADHPPYLEEFVMNSEENKITLSLRVANPFDHEIKSLLLNGVSQKITLTTTVKMNRFNLYLVKFNQKINTNTYTHNIEYDNLKKLFTVITPPHTKLIETSSYKEAIKVATQFKHLTLLNRCQLKENRDYQVDTQTEIRKVRLPFHLEYLFFFLSAWDRKSNTYTIDIPERLITETLKR
ncbi:MAG: DUF4390 domain-containing protein [Deltaproteobacteria bacterium]|nr:DUF4390 domain-containing protein [Candidatus Tharpella sp.]